jgi:hypothetical protein
MTTLSAEPGSAKESVPPKQKTGRWKFGNPLPWLAFGLSLFSLYFSHSAQNSVAQIDAVKTQYGLFNDMSHMMTEHPMMVHLFAVTPREYEEQVKVIKAATSSLKPEERAKLLLQERAIAHYIFTVYAETHLLWQQAAEGDQRKRQLLEQELEFFNDMFCSNYRLAWYWDRAAGDRMSASFGSELGKYYDEKVVKACSPDKDNQGPFTGGELK